MLSPRRSKQGFDMEDEEAASCVSASEAFSADDAASTDTDGQQGPNLGARVTRAVRSLKNVVLLILFGAALTVSGLTYKYTRNDEVNEFHDTFDQYAEQIIKTVGTNVQNKLEAIGALALQLQAYAVNQNKTWPFITVPFFEEHVMASKSLIDAHGVLLFPIVSQENRLEWEQYSLDHREWINNSYAAQQHVYGTDGLTDEVGELEAPIDWFDILWGEDYLNDNNPDFSAGVSSQIFTTVHDDDPDLHDPVIDDLEQGSLFPQWQTAPLDWYYQSTINANYGHFEDFYNQTEIVMNTRSAAFGPAWDDDNSPGLLSTMLYPIFDRFYGDQSVVAFLSMDIFWVEFLRGILPPNDDGVYVVIENTCDQVFTYQLIGGQVEFLGEEDLHERDFDDMKKSTEFGKQLMEPISSPTYTGRPLYGDYCPYSFRIYPSTRMENHYITKNPIIFSVVIAMVFLFTSLVFVGYDFLVEYRQKTVVRSATRADALVSSLFPSAVKNRLYQGQRKEEAKTDVKNFMGETNPNLKNDQDNDDDVSPIADLYPETSIMFSDIAGFTQWSNGRLPSDVFLLLETIYGAFDKIAKKRHVFKVETIGDCYVAVTGIPRPQEKHALIMTNFAKECQATLRGVLSQLADSLGEETMDLAMRTGIHSGPVTAGVLRGDKARFQLFGDTMNTASRMESNGVKNRIHISEATANLLSRDGKAHWLKKREDKIIAKGKGEMQTYFVDAKSATTVISSTSGSGDSALINDSSGASPSKSDASDIADPNADIVVKPRFDTVHSHLETTPEADPSTLDRVAPKRSLFHTNVNVDAPVTAKELDKSALVQNGNADKEESSLDDLSKKLHQRLSGKDPAYFL